MRDFINKYGIAVVVVCVIIGGIAVYFATRPPQGIDDGVDLSKAFYVDEETMEEKVLPITENPPLMGASGKPTVVRAVKFSRDGGKTSEYLYFAKYTDEVKQRLDSLPTEGPDKEIGDLERNDLMMRGELVRSPKPGSPWVPSNSQPGMQLKAYPESTDGKPVVIVNPKKGQ